MGVRFKFVGVLEGEGAAWHLALKSQLGLLSI